MAINTYLSIITLNVNGLHALVKRQSGRLDEKQEPTVGCLQETPSLFHCPSLSFFVVFVLKSILSDMSIATPTLSFPSA